MRMFRFTVTRKVSSGSSVALAATAGRRPQRPPPRSLRFGRLRWRTQIFPSPPEVKGDLCARGRLRVRPQAAASKALRGAVCRRRGLQLAPVYNDVRKEGRIESCDVGKVDAAWTREQVQSNGGQVKQVTEAVGE